MRKGKGLTKRTPKLTGTDSEVALSRGEGAGAGRRAQRGSEVAEETWLRAQGVNTRSNMQTRYDRIVC